MAIMRIAPNVTVQDLNTFVSVKSGTPRFSTLGNLMESPLHNIFERSNVKNDENNNNKNACGNLVTESVLYRVCNTPAQTHQLAPVGHR